MAAPNSVVNKSYRVVGKPHRVIQPGGAMVIFEVGDIIDGLRLSDLVAFKDRFVPATQDEVEAYQQRQAAVLAVIDEAPLVADAAQAAAEEVALEVELVRVQQRLQDARHRKALAEELKAEAEEARQAQRFPATTRGRASTGLMPAVQPEVDRLAVQQPEATRMEAEQAEVNRQAVEKAAASKK